MTTINKKTFYEVDPRFFKDDSGTGTGDLKGLTTKIDYFDFIGINSVILQNVLSANSDDDVQNFTQIAKDLGDVNDLKRAISVGQQKGISFLVELPIGSIKESHKWFANATDEANDEFKDVIDLQPQAEEGMSAKYSKETKSYYQIDEHTKEVPLNWRSENVLENFIKVIRFWVGLGVKGFVFRDFEYIGETDKNEAMSDHTLRELRKFYRTIKEINDNILIIGKSEIVTEKTNAFTDGATKVFDLFMPMHISKIGTDSKYGNDVVKGFKTSKLAKLLKESLENTNNIITFGSNETGRINSRWGDDGQYSSESSKALAMLLLLHPSSSSIYYGDEIGSLNIGLTHLDNFQDKTLKARKQEMIQANVKEKEFMQAQVLQNSINGRSLMAWDDGKNGGFSVSEKTITPVSDSHKEINVKNQFADNASSLLFVKELVRIISSSTYKKIITDGKFTISSLVPGVIKLVAKLDEKEVLIYVNMSTKTKPIKRAKEGKVVLSTKAYKTYEELPKSLDPFEGIIISKKTDIAIKEKTRELKMKHAEEEAVKNAEARAAQIEKDEKEAKIQAIADEKAAVKKAKDDEKAEKLRASQEEQARIDREKLEGEKKKEKEEKAEAKEIEKTRVIELKEIAKAEKEAEHQERKAKEEEEKRERRETAESLKQEMFDAKDVENKERHDSKEAKRHEKEQERTRNLNLKEEEIKHEEVTEENIEKHEEAAAKAREKIEKNQLKEARKQQKQEEKTRLIELKQAEKAQKAEDSFAEEQKRKMQIEKEAAKELNNSQKDFSINEEAIHESERTTLTEEDIATTTQIDPDEFDDFDLFMSNEENNKKK